MIEGTLLFEKLEKAILERVKTDATPELREEAARFWSELKESHRLMEESVAEFQSLSSTSGTKARIELERLLSNQQLINEKGREMLEKAHKTPAVSIKEIRPSP